MGLSESTRSSRHFRYSLELYAFFYEVDIALSLRNKVTSSFVAMCHFVQSDAYCSARRCLGFLARVACCACAQCLFQRNPFCFQTETVDAVMSLDV